MHHTINSAYGIYITCKVPKQKHSKPQTTVHCYLQLKLCGKQ